MTFTPDPNPIHSSRPGIHRRAPDIFLLSQNPNILPSSQTPLIHVFSTYRLYSTPLSSPIFSLSRRLLRPPFVRSPWALHVYSRLYVVSS